MKLLYPDPRRRRPRFKLPGSAGAGPRQSTDSRELCIMPEVQLGREGSVGGGVS